MKIIITILSLLPYVGFSQHVYKIETTDISNFWTAYDDFEFAQTRSDSIRIIQKQYIDISSEYFKEFIKARKFTAEEYVDMIAKYPKFWKSVRPLTESIENKKEEIERIFEKYRRLLPNFKQPNICFAIGCLRTGGTTRKNLILIGAEIAVSNQEADKSEMNGWLESVIGSSGDIASMIAHETVHTQQFDKRLIKSGKNVLLEQSMKEGIADFFSIELLGLNINEKVFEYGDRHKCELFREFKRDLEEHPNEYTRWLYQGNNSMNRPADLGYFIGYHIAKMYYDKSENKSRAIQKLLNIKKYKKILGRSEFNKESCR